MNKRIEAAYEQRPRRWVFELAVAVVVVALLIWSGSAVETAGTTQNGAVIAWNILAGIFHPDTDLLFNFTTQGVPYLLLETICIAFLGTIVGAIISVPLAFLSASNLTPKPVAFVGRIIIMAVRTVPAFVYGLMFIRVTGPGAFAGLLTMSLCSVGMVSKMYMDRFNVAVKVVQNAGDLLRQCRLEEAEVSQKTGHQDLVTRWDRRIEQLLRNEILTAFPQDAIVGEEYPPEAHRTGAVTWYIQRNSGRSMRKKSCCTRPPRKPSTS